jgi:hypothetical protein
MYSISHATFPDILPYFCHASETREPCSIGPRLIRPGLLRLYQQTHYEVSGIPFRIGRRCPAIDEHLRKNRSRTAVFITADNPGSKRRFAAWNAVAHTRLLRDLRRRNSLPGLGCFCQWSEIHRLVFAPVAPMIKLARKYRQNVIVIFAIGRPVWLLSVLSGTNLSPMRTVPDGRFRRHNIASGGVTSPHAA